MKTFGCGQGLLLVALQLLAMAALGSPPAAGEIPQTPISSMADYQPVPLGRLAELRDQDPKRLVIRAFDHGERPHTEGLRQESILVTDHGHQAEVLLQIVGLMDDSVLGIRYRSELEMEGDSWKFVRVGRQSICRPGRGHQEWSASPCR